MLWARIYESYRLFLFFGEDTIILQRFFILSHFQTLRTTIGLWVFWPRLTCFHWSLSKIKCQYPACKSSCQFQPIWKIHQSTSKSCPKTSWTWVKHNLYLKQLYRKKPEKRKKTLGVTTNRGVTKHLEWQTTGPWTSLTPVDETAFLGAVSECFSFIFQMHLIQTYGKTYRSKVYSIEKHVKTSTWRIQDWQPIIYVLRHSKHDLHVFQVTHSVSSIWKKIIFRELLRDVFPQSVPT